MNHSMRFCFVGVVVAVSCIGCKGGSKSKDNPDATVVDGSVDGRVDGAMAATCPTNMAGATVGSACRLDRDENLVCTTESLNCVARRTASIDTVLADGGMGPSIPVARTPGTMCSRECEPGKDDCEGCGICSAVLGSTGETFLTFPTSECRPYCVPSLHNRGTCREGYTCELERQICVEACDSDDRCKLHFENVRGDEEAEIVYDPSSPATCDETTGRCVFPENASAHVGDACARSSDCPSEGFCIRGYPQGYCTTTSCDAPDFACASGSTCALRGNITLPYPSCYKECRVGQEPLTDRRGAGGHGAGCRTGYSCRWDGTSLVQDNPNGMCVPGSYNDVAVSNVGELCDVDADCYSPFGLGRCFNPARMRFDRGICTIVDCSQNPEGLRPGVSASGVCSVIDGNVCAGDINGTACFKGCTSPVQCPAGYACSLVGEAILSTCVPYCTSDNECHPGANCRDEAGGTCNQNETCYCSDAVVVPPPDGGTDAGDVGDAGMDAGSGA